MTKELFVSSTPHETKVGLVEDDQLAEVYMERENEYTLAGSIYKGRVTRVLPGMQSAFVDIGLERDAFLYVSDFMELQDHDEDLDELPATRGVADVGVPPQPEPERMAAAEPEAKTEPEAASTSGVAANGGGGREERDRGWRGRRRRGRRDRFPRAAQSESRPEREEYGPPPGFEPIILPGESISKYRGRAQSQTQEPGAGGELPSTHEEASAGASETFPKDDLLFPKRQAAGRGPERDRAASSRSEGVEAGALPHSRETRSAQPDHEPEVEEWDRDPRHLAEETKGGGFGENGEEIDGEAVSSADEPGAPGAEAFVSRTGAQAPKQAFEEEEIDEEEADLSAYVEELEEEAAFDEFEEETHAAGEPHAAITEEPTGESASPRVHVPFSPEPVSEETAEIEQSTEEVDDAAQEEAELEKAQ
ncbi:MAG: hypothetical protein J2P13_11705, partial [Acidobacteria bacterium]|nr:hypothetical protein [Acidobacteriota bacterium]